MSNEKHPGKTLAEIPPLLGLEKTSVHLFLCTGEACSKDKGSFTWEALKTAIKNAHPILAETPIYRTRVGCLRICKNGPIALAYPHGKWFHGITPQEIPSLLTYLQETLEQPSAEKHPLEFYEHPL